MAHEIAKSLLEQASTPLLRVKAVRVAFRLGMPLHEIEDYLDWLDAVRAKRRKPHKEQREPDRRS